MALEFSDYTFVPDDFGESGAVLVPADAFVGEPPVSIPVVDLAGRSVAYEGGGRCYYTCALAGTRDFYGWSYWESEATEDLDRPTINLVVLAPGFDPAEYRG